MSPAPRSGRAAILVALVAAIGLLAVVAGLWRGASVSAPPSVDAVPAGMTGPRATSSLTPTAAFDRDGRLWLAWVEGAHILVSHSADQGLTFAPAVRVTGDAETIDANSESRPKLAFNEAGDVLLSWTRSGRAPFTGDIRFSRSADGGQTFTAPVTINDDGMETGHRFDALHVSPAGQIYLAWIDKRDGDRAVAAGQAYAGAALYYAVSADGGRTFQPNRKIKDHVCECCRLAIDFDHGGSPVMVWRDVIDGTTRDHGILRFEDPVTHGVPRRATADGWKIDACPHHGPSLSIASDGTYHMTWFTGEGPDGAGAFYARSTDQGDTFSPPLRIGARDTQGHAVVLSRGSRVVVAWKVLVPPASVAIQVMQSDDAGLTWGAPVEVARTEARSDHPFLLARGSDVLLSWFTSAEGYRLLPIPAVRRDGP